MVHSPEINHSDREHAVWSASATERNWNCPGALCLTITMPSTTSEAADWGTCCHELAEMCLTNGTDAEEYLDLELKGKEYDFAVDEEMAETAQQYIDYVRETSEGKQLYIEQKFSLNKLGLPFGAGGTADAVIYHEDKRLLEVVDLKTGRGVVVEAEENPQLRTYALGAWLANQELKVSHVRTTIVQPRAPHKSGRIRSETVDAVELMDWTQNLIYKAEASKKAMDARATTTEADWVKTYLKPGSHCKKTFCPVAGSCKALEAFALDAAGVWFDDLDKPHLTNQPDAEDPAKLARDLDTIELVETWCSARRALAYNLAESGVSIKNPVSGSEYILVQKEGREKWAKGEEETVLGILSKSSVDESKYLNPPKLRTPKQIRKELQKFEQAHIISGFSEVATGKTSLVRADKTTKTAVEPAVNQFFDTL